MPTYTGTLRRSSGSLKICSKVTRPRDICTVHSILAFTVLKLFPPPRQTTSGTRNGPSQDLPLSDFKPHLFSSLIFFDFFLGIATHAYEQSPHNKCLNPSFVFLPNTSKVVDFQVPSHKFPTTSTIATCIQPYQFRTIQASHNVAMKETSGSVFGKWTEKWEDDVEKAKAAEAFLQRRRRELKARITAIRRKRKTSPKKQHEKKPARPEKQVASLVPADNRDIKALSVSTYFCRNDKC